jgi:hypothetical protein
MKKLGILTLFIAAIAFVACSTVTNLSNSNSAAKAAGTGCGNVLGNLLTQYKANGKKIDMTNTTTLLNVIELGTYYSTLKANQSDPNYKKEFAAGLVLGSNGLISNSKSLQVVNSLLTMNSLGDVSSSTTGTSSTAVNVAAALTGLLVNMNQTPQQ